MLEQNHAVVHMNEVACAILDLDANEVEGNRLEDVSSRNMHVAKLLAATQEGATAPATTAPSSSCSCAGAITAT